MKNIRKNRLVALALCLGLLVGLCACGGTAGVSVESWSKQEEQLLDELGMLNRVGRFTLTSPQGTKSLLLHYYELAEDGTWVQVNYGGTIFDDTPEIQTLTIREHDDGRLELHWFGCVLYFDPTQESDIETGSMRLFATTSQPAALGDEIPLYMHLISADNTLPAGSIDDFYNSGKLAGYAAGRAVTVSFQELDDMEETT